jgi:hypothetical protein
LIARPISEKSKEEIKMAVGDIILGDGAFYINDTLIALTRGGGQFVVERTYRQIAADGDYGPVKGRIRKTMSIPKLTLNALELLDTNITSMYPALVLTSETDGSTITADTDVDDSDYIDEVVWVGNTLEGRSVRIEIYNAINLENIDWSMVDKEEIVPKVTYTGSYSESARTTEPWKLQYADEYY